MGVACQITVLDASRTLIVHPYGGTAIAINSAIPNGGIAASQDLNSRGVAEDVAVLQRTLTFVIDTDSISLVGVVNLTPPDNRVRRGAVNSHTLP